MRRKTITRYVRPPQSSRVLLDAGMLMAIALMLLISTAALVTAVVKIGPQGDSGEDGSRGEKGETGDKGGGGDAGINGINGINGAAGVCNCSAEIAVAEGPYAGSFGILGFAPTGIAIEQVVTTQNAWIHVVNVSTLFTRGPGAAASDPAAHSIILVSPGIWQADGAIGWDQTDGGSPRNFQFGLAFNSTFDANNEFVAGFIAAGISQRAVNAVGDKNNFGFNNLVPVGAPSTEVTFVFRNTEGTDNMNIDAISLRFVLLRP